MSSNILFLPFRRTHPAKLSDAIKDYISDKYDQHPEMFTADLEEVDRLRNSAANAVEPHISGIKKLQSYAAQLVWLGGKFPVDIGVDFSWYPALGYNTQRAITQNNVRFELANIVYNLAVMYSQLALSSNRGTSDGLKTACNYFCLAAGTLLHLNTYIVPDMRTTPPDDMDTMTLESLHHLMLAQAQECFWQKAVKDGLKDASISKLAAKVSDFYSDAGDYAIKSEAISAEWIHHMTAKHHHFAAAAQYRAACDCLEKRKYGEEVARLRDSLACVNEALKESRYINKSVLADLNGLKNRVSEDLKRAEKDNDMIYLLPVPPKPELKILDRASMASSKVPKEVEEPLSLMGENGQLGRPLFSRLVPYSVHVAASIYADKRDRLVNNTIDELERLTERLHDILTSLNLPGSLQALEKPLGLPPALVAHAEEIRQQDGLDRLNRSIGETERIKNSDKAVYEEGVHLLQSELEEDRAARMRYGTDRWNRLSSEEAAPKLHAQIEDITGYLNSAANSDDIVRRKMTDNEKYIRLLAGTDRDLENYVPSSRRAAMPPSLENEVVRLRNCLNDVSRLESKRRKKIDALRTKAKHDDVNPDLLQEAARLEREYPMQTIEAVQFEQLFDKRLRRYDPDTSDVHTEGADQDALAKRLRDLNAVFVKARAGDSSSRQREQALQNLENGFFKYKEIVSNLDVGRKFYNDLARIVTRFRDDARSFAFQRRAEATQLQQNLAVVGMTQLSLQRDSEQQLQQQQHQQQEQQQQPPLPPAAPAGGMWQPEMGIRFGGMGGQAPAPAPQQADGKWSPSKGLRFG